MFNAFVVLDIKIVFQYKNMLMIIMSWVYFVHCKKLYSTLMSYDFMSGMEELELTIEIEG